MDLTLKICIGVLMFMGLLWLKSIYDTRSYQKRMLVRIRADWGKLPEEEYTSQKMDGIACYFREHMKPGDIDDITWNDLDLDSIYQQLNQTKCSMGQEVLYALLRKPLLAEEELLERERVIRYLTEHQEEREKLEVALGVMGKNDRFSIYPYLANVRSLQKKSSVMHILQLVALVVCIVLCFFAPTNMIIPTVVVVVYNMVTYYRTKAEMDRYYQLFSYILRMLTFCKDISKLNIPGIDKYTHLLKSDTDSLKQFARGSNLVTGGSGMDGNLLDAVMDYVRMLFHIDIIKFQSMVSQVILHEKELMRLFETIGYLDSMIAIASWRQMKGDWCEPEFTEGNGKNWSATQMYHPLIATPVKNDLSTQGSVLLTGSNASGKSTFIKTVAVNSLLAQTFHTVLADSYRACFYRIYSSMALRDDIQSQESYYIVEIKSLKRILDQVDEQKTPVLCFIDEVLRGTNTLERIASSAQILHQLAGQNALCFAATHDIELTTLLEDRFTNYHFEERVEEQDVLFDYALRKGPAMTRNAIKLLAMIGYEKEITRRASESVDYFNAKGEWRL